MQRFCVLALVLIGCASQRRPLLPQFSAPVPSAAPVQENKPETLEARTARLIEAAARYDFAAASVDFDDAMAAALTAQKFAAMWSAVEQQLGRLQTIVLQGERDYQVSMTEFQDWVSALGQHKGALLKSYRR